MIVPNVGIASEGQTLTLTQSPKLVQDKALSLFKTCVFSTATKQRLRNLVSPSFDLTPLFNNHLTIPLGGKRVRVVGEDY